MLDDLRKAGGDTTMEHIRRAEGSKLINKIGTSSNNTPMTGDSVRAIVQKNEALRNILESGENGGNTVDRYAEIADNRAANIAHNKALNAMNELHGQGLKDDMSLMKSMASNNESDLSSQLDKGSELLDQSRKALDKSMKMTADDRQSFIDRANDSAQKGKISYDRQMAKNAAAEDARVAAIRAQEHLEGLSKMQKAWNMARNYIAGKTGGTVGGVPKAPLMNISDIIPDLPGK